MAISKVFKRAYPLDLSWSLRIRTSLWVGLFVALFLFVFQPFELSGLRGAVLMVSMGYGAISTLIMLFLHWIGLNILRPWFSEENWNIVREWTWILVHLLFIGAGNYAFSVALGFAGSQWSHFWRFEAYTLAVGIFPVAGMVLFNQQRLSEKYTRESDELNAQVQQANATEHTEKARPIELKAENGQTELRFSLQALLCIQAAQNYCEVYLLENAEVSRKLIRQSLKSLEEQLAEHPSIFRCHKSHLINLQHLRKVSGNAQGYRIHLHAAEIAIPVARSKNEELKQKMNHNYMGSGA